MKKIILLMQLILLIFLYNYCSPHQRQIHDIETNKVNYIPYYHDPSGSFIMVDGVINDSIHAAFEMDSGVTICDITIDSAFFFDNFDITSFEHQKSQAKMMFYDEYFIGKLKIKIDNHIFTAENIRVKNLNITQRKGTISNAILGAKVFENKITLFNFEKRQIAFVDSIDVDSSYTMVDFCPPRGDSVITNAKYLKIEGLKDKEGISIQTQFLFDLGNVSTAISIKNELGTNISNPLHNQSVSHAVGSWNIPIKQIKGNIDSLTIGGYALKQPIIGYCAEKGIMDPLSQIRGGDGMVGLPFLVKFNLIADYKKNVLYLKPNAYFKTGALYYWDTSRDSIYLANNL